MVPSTAMNAIRGMSVVLFGLCMRTIEGIRRATAANQKHAHQLSSKLVQNVSQFTSDQLPKSAINSRPVENVPQRI